MLKQYDRLWDEADVKKSVTVLFLLKRLDCNDGVASYCETIIKGLVARGDRVVMVTGPVTALFGSESRRLAIKSAVIEWIVIEDIGRKRLSPKLIMKLRNIVVGNDVDVISPQGLSILPLAVLLSFVCRRPVVANYHPSLVGNSTTGMPTKRSAKTKLLTRILLTVFRPTKLIAISSDIVEFFHVDCGVSRDRICLIVNGVDLEKFRPPTQDERIAYRHEKGILDGMLVCILCARMNFVKGHDVAVDSIRILRKMKPDLEVICYFAGAGDQGDEIRNYALKDDADRFSFRFEGFLSGAEALRRMYWISDIALLPSRFEGSPISVAEAMSCGCVPIRTPSGGWKDQILDEENGYIIPFDDAEALAQKILVLADPTRRSEMSGKAAAFARERLGQKTMVDTTSELFRNVASL